MDKELGGAVLGALRNRPLGDVDLASYRATADFGRASSDAAANLLRKAAEALEACDEERARAHVDRAARLPFDDSEDWAPAAAEASMVLFNAVADAFEESYNGELAWIRAAGTAASRSDDVGRVQMRATLQTIGSEYEVSRKERAAIRAVTATLPAGPELRDQILEPRELSASIMSVLKLCAAYEDLLG